MQETNNSIFSDITKDEIINDIRLTLSSTPDNEDVILIVEGEDDIKFLKNYVDENVEIKESFSGCQGIKEIVEELEEIIPNNSRFIGIRDRDYEELLDNERIFYYDYNSLEVFLINSDEVLTKIYNEYYNGKKNKNSIRATILKELKLLGMIRKLNYEKKWGLKLKGLSIDKAYDENSNTLKRESIIEQINNMNNNFFNNIENIKLLDEKLNETTSQDDLLMIARGHDVIHLFKSICNGENTKNAKAKGKKLSKTRGLNPSDIASSMRCAYTSKELEKTELYKSIKEYEYKKNVKVFNV